MQWKQITNHSNTLRSALETASKGYRGQVWADAVCINQQDLTEKTEQIRLMGNIYQQAKQVFIWLGEEEENDKADFRLMYQINQSLEREGPSITGRPTPDLSSDGLGLTRIPPASWRGLLSILGRSWFWRVRVVQEYLMASSRIFQCGRFTIPESEIRGVFARLNHHPDSKYIAMARRGEDFTIDSSGMLVGPVFVFTNLPPGGLWLTVLLSKSRGLRSSDPKDRFFALVSLSNDTPASFIDYRRDFGDLLRDTTRRKFQAILASPEPSELFQYLAMVSTTECTEGRSSWAPFHDQSSLFRGMGVLFRMGNRLESIPEVDFPDSKVIRFKGKIFDSVQKILVSKAFSEPGAWIDKKNAQKTIDQNRETLTFYEQVWNLVSQTKQYVNGENIEEAFWRSLIFNTQDERIKASPDMVECFQSNRECHALTILWAELGPLGLVGHRDSLSTILHEARKLVPDLRWQPPLEKSDASCTTYGLI